MRKVDRVDGDVDALSKRIAYVRTWTYVSQRGHWLEDAAHWRERTRAIEDRLSDALHVRLTQRFIDLRTSVLVKGMKRKEKLVTTVNDKGEVTVEGQFVGRLDGFRFFPDAGAAPEASKAIKAASAQALAPELTLRSQKLSNAPNNELGFTEQGGLMWGDVAVGKLVVGADALSPRIEVFVDEEAGADVGGKVERRLKVFVDHQITSNFEHLIALKNDSGIDGISRGFAFRLIENLGIVNRWALAEEVKALDQDARKPLRTHGVRFGQYSIFLHSILKPAPTRLRVLLWSLWKGHQEFPPPPPPSLVTIPVMNSAPEGYYPVCGFHRAGELAIRIDMLERLADLLRSEDSRAGFEASSDMLSISGLNLEQFASLMRGLGYQATSGVRLKEKPAKTNAVEKAEKITDPRSEEIGNAPNAESSAVVAETEFANSERAGEKQLEKAPSARRNRAGEENADASYAKGHEVVGVAAASTVTNGSRPAPAVPENGDSPIAHAQNADSSDDGKNSTSNCEKEEVVFYTFTWVSKRKKQFRREGRKNARMQPEARVTRPSSGVGSEAPEKRSEKRLHSRNEKRDPKMGKRDKAPNAKKIKTSPPRAEFDPDSPFAALMSLKKKL